MQTLLGLSSTNYILRVLFCFIPCLSSPCTLSSISLRFSVTSIVPWVPCNLAFKMILGFPPFLPWIHSTLTSHVPWVFVYVSYKPWNFWFKMSALYFQISYFRIFNGVWVLRQSFLLLCVWLIRSICICWNVWMLIFCFLISLVLVLFEIVYSFLKEFIYGSM